MRTPRGILPALLALAVFSACSSNSTAPASDADGDGIADTDDPNPTGATFNRLNGTFTGGDAAVVEMTWLDDSGAADASGNYEDDLTADCSASWYPQGTLCDESPTTPT